MVCDYCNEGWLGVWFVFGLLKFLIKVMFCVVYVLVVVVFGGVV